ncbi:unnamed protein product [Nippostrongylus brasiliensis]|uniref:non-specific serine/threonine protein kinase n=1 Tax=Nippostrongylus brasiliensis TaxID=27835 RepID=A0A158QWT5_NIPBR|nr:unnamed protein product [Nippostrongylus brasiliensis]
MQPHWLAGLLLLLWLQQQAVCLFPGAVPDEGDVRHLYPITQIAIALDGHAHMIPYLLGWWKNAVASLFNSLEIVTWEKSWLEHALRVQKQFWLLSEKDLNSTEVVMSALFAPVLDSEVVNAATLDDDYINGKVVERRKVIKSQIKEVVLPMLVNTDLMDASYLTFDADNLPKYSEGPDPFQLRYLLADMIADGARLPTPSHTVRPWTPERELWSVDRAPIRIDTARDQQHAIDEAAELCSMPYRAPELFNCEIGTVITESTDLWSLGCCLYALCYFVSPFDLVYEKGNSVALAVQSPEKIQYPDVNQYVFQQYDARLAAVMRRLLVVDATQRMPLEEVINVLSPLDAGGRGGNDSIRIV